MTQIYGVGKVKNVEQLNELEFYADGKYTFRVFHEATDIDEEIAKEPCSECGGEREYRAVYDADSYRAFSVCRRCNSVIEF